MSFLDLASLQSYEQKRAEIAKYYTGITLDINARWEQGIPHHPRSLSLMVQLENLDLYFGGDRFCWKVGGDGDNGESLMYLTDIIFEMEDSQSRPIAE